MEGSDVFRACLWFRPTFFFSSFWFFLYSHSQLLIVHSDHTLNLPACASNQKGLLFFMHGLLVKCSNYIKGNISSTFWNGKRFLFRNLYHIDFKFKCFTVIIGMFIKNTWYFWHKCSDFYLMFLHCVNITLYKVGLIFV